MHLKILITGANGMVGHNIADKFSDYYNNILTPSRKELNLLDINITREYIAKYKPDFIIHCAGKVGGIQANILNPVDFLYENMIIGFNLINEAKKVGIPNLINLGSSCMYPADYDGFLTENMVLSGKLEPTNEGYAIAKCSCAKLCSYISSRNNLKYKTIIPCNLYGKYDKFDINKAHMIPSAINKIEYAIQHRLPTVSIWGDGKTRREFMYADDLADFILFAIKNFEYMPDIINCGLGKDYSIDEYYQTIGHVLGYTGEFTHDLSKPVGMKRKVVDISLQTQLGFIPKTPLKEGIIKTYEYYKSIQTCQ